MSKGRCQTLKNSSYHDNFVPVRIVLYDNCSNILFDVLNEIIENLRMPYILAFQKRSGSVIREVVENRSDIGASYYVNSYKRFGLIDFSPMLGYGSPISILSGKIFANTGNHLFNSIQYLKQFPNRSVDNFWHYLNYSGNF